MRDSKKGTASHKYVGFYRRLQVYQQGIQETTTDLLPRITGLAITPGLVAFATATAILCATFRHVHNAGIQITDHIGACFAYREIESLVEIDHTLLLLTKMMDFSFAFVSNLAFLLLLLFLFLLLLLLLLLLLSTKLLSFLAAFVSNLACF
jgi:hypothetical protein